MLEIKDIKTAKTHYEEIKGLYDQFLPKFTDYLKDQIDIEIIHEKDSEATYFEYIGNKISIEFISKCFWDDDYAQGGGNIACRVMNQHNEIDPPPFFIIVFDKDGISAMTNVDTAQIDRVDDRQEIDSEPIMMEITKMLLGSIVKRKHIL